MPPDRCVLERYGRKVILPPIFNKETGMAKEKKSIEDLKKGQKPLDKKDMKKVTGGKRKRRWGGRGCGGIVPQ
jgi:hypothetical protein